MSQGENSAILDERSREIADAYSTGNIDKLMSFFSKEATFSDAVSGVFDLDCNSLRGFFEGIYSQVANVTASNTKVWGRPEFMAWEVDFGFTIKEDIKVLGLQKGQKSIFKGVALCYWRKEEGGWKIWKEDDYFVKYSVE